ncbi:MAG: SulP family inorganic anion transporter [Sediminibacterium sp.]|jgi:MFS superfamily sulfate permease-like transporter
MNLNKPTQGLSFKYLKEDLPAGLVVFLVALPLCLGIALASGAPLFSGIIAGIVGGIIVAFASGSALSVSGPAAGLTVIVLNGITTLGAYDHFLVAVVIAGILQIVLGYLKAGVIGYYFPSSVIKGMLAAIGIILILKQAPIAIGYSKANSISYHFGSIIIASISIAIILFWELPILKKYSFFKYVPGALIAVLAGVALNIFFNANMPAWALSADALVKLPVAKTSTEFIGQFTLPNFAALSNYHVYVIAVTIAIIASLETLLSVEAGDKLDPHKRVTPTNRELKAQGLGNLISGMIGGLPMTAVIVRTSANVNSGAKTKLSAIFHGLLLLISVVAFASVLNQIPLACLAAVLLVVGYKLAKVSLFKQMYQLGWVQFVPFIVTVIAIQFSDLLKGIALGMLVAIFYILRTNYRRDYQFHHEKKSEGGEITIVLSEHVTFINKGSIAKKLSDIQNDTKVTIDASQSHYLDLDVIEIIYDFEIAAKLKNIEVTLVNMPARVAVSGH